MWQNTVPHMLPSGSLRLCGEEREPMQTEQKAEVSVSEMEDGETAVGCLSNGIAAKNEERSLREIKKPSVCSLISC